MTTLKSLAQELNLSVMAVSKALRDAPDISLKTKERVCALAHKRQYIPNQAAQNLRLQCSHLLGVLLPEIHQSHYAHLIWEIERAAQSQGYQLILAHSLGQEEVEMEQARRLFARQIDGLLLVPVVRWQQRFQTIEMAMAKNIPVILLDHYPAGIERFAHQVAAVVHEDERGTRQATEYLLEKGHRDILYLAGPHGSSSSAARLMGYRQAMKAFEAPSRTEERIFLAGESIEEGAQAMERMIRACLPFTAVVTFNDFIAFGAMRILLEKGIQVPQQVSFIGFGDSLLAEHFRIPLTTMRIAVEKLGNQALQSLFQLINKKSQSPPLLPVELIERESTAPAPSQPWQW